MEGLGKADALAVLMSHDALTRPWINFEIGFAAARDIRVLIFCHRGLTPAALPTPYSTLQTVDLNAAHNDDERFDLASNAVGSALNLAASRDERIPSGSPADDAEDFSSTLRTWNIRPAAHKDKLAQGRFLIGSVGSARPELARAAGLSPGETLRVRFFLGAIPDGQYINVLVTGDTAAFFERVLRDTTIIDASVRLAASYDDRRTERTIPIIVLDTYEVVAG